MMRGKNAESAYATLRFSSGKAPRFAAEVLKSAMAIAKENDLDADKLYVKTVFCNEGPRLKRRQMVSKGRATAITKRMSHLTLIISDEAGENKESKNKDKSEKPKENIEKAKETNKEKSE